MGVVHVTLPPLAGLGQCLPPAVAQQYLHDHLLLQHGGQSPTECNHVSKGSRERGGEKGENVVVKMGEEGEEKMEGKRERGECRETKVKGRRGGEKGRTGQKKQEGCLNV